MAHDELVAQLSPRQRAHLDKPHDGCPTTPAGTYRLRTGRYGPYVQCNECGDKLRRPRGRTADTSPIHVTIPASAMAEAEAVEAKRDAFTSIIRTLVESEKTPDARRSIVDLKDAVAPPAKDPAVVATEYSVDLDAVKAWARTHGEKALTMHWYELLAGTAPLFAVPGPYRILFWGPPGTGKTTAAQKLFGGKRKVRHVTVTRETLPEDIVGTLWLNAASTGFRKGPAIQAWEEGSVLVINEIDRAENGVEATLHALLDDASVANMQLPDGTEVRPAPGTVIVATTNAPPESLEEALLDRFDAIIYAGKPTKEFYERLTPPVAHMVRNYYAALKRPAAFKPVADARRGLAFSTFQTLTGSATVAAALVGGGAGAELLSVHASATMAVKGGAK